MRPLSLISGGLAAAVAVGLAVAGSCAAAKKGPAGNKLAILYQSNNNGEIEPCG